MKQIIILIGIIFLALLVSCKQAEDPNVIITEDGEPTGDVEEPIEVEDDTDATEDETTDDDQEDNTTADKDQENATDDSTEQTIPESSDNQEIIIMSDITFSPKKLTVEAGTNILLIHNDKYNNKDNIVHVVRFYPMTPSMEFKSVQSGRMTYGDKFNVTLDEPGEYYFLDIIFKNQMKGYITVTE